MCQLLEYLHIQDPDCPGECGTTKHCIDTQPDS